MKSIKKYQEGGRYSGKPNVTQYFRPLLKEEMQGIREGLQDFVEKRPERLEKREENKASRIKRRERRRRGRYSTERLMNPQESAELIDELEKKIRYKNGGKVKPYLKKKKKGY